MAQQRYRYKVLDVWGSMENNEQVYPGATVIDVDKCLPGDDTAQWDIFNLSTMEEVGGWTGRKIGECGP